MSYNEGKQSGNGKAQRLLRLAARGIKVWRLMGFKGFAKGIYYKFYDQISLIQRSSLFSLPRSLQDTYIKEDNSQVTLFTDRNDLFPVYWPRQSLTDDKNLPLPKVSIIAPCLNENDSAAMWLESLMKQSALPDEVIVVDTGSVDGTPDTLQSLSANLPFQLKIYRKPGSNIAQARNFAINETRNEVIIALDFGCIPHPDWLMNLSTPWRINEKLDVAFGWFRAVNSRGQVSRFKGWAALEQVQPQEHIPASRALAFTKSAWSMAGGYPEWLTLSGEDTYFALELKRFCLNWAFVPDALINWSAPDNFGAFLRKSYYWCSGDGETGVDAWLYRLSAKWLLRFTLSMLISILLLFAGYRFFTVGSLLPASAATIAAVFSLCLGSYPYSKAGVPFFQIPAELALRFFQVLGFLKGASRKSRVDLRRLVGVKGLYFVLAGVPIDDTGGGARCTQLALELLRQNYWVVYINRYPKWEAKDVGVKIGHPNLFLYELNQFYWDDFVKKYESIFSILPKFGLIELPSADFLPLITKIKKNGGKVIYEMIDDWNTSLGGQWYSVEAEKEIIEISHTLIGTAPVLQEKLTQISKREVHFLPNAVNSRLFNPNRRYPRPEDLPTAKWVATYIGALWGDWFDWDLLTGLARRYPEASVTVIGDYRGQCPNPPENLKFLGLKPQSSLPAYLAHSDVAIIPWKVNDITQATSPLKLYEYLAMQKPVIAPNIKPLRNMPGVFLAKDSEDFIGLAGKVYKENIPLDQIGAFILENNWQSRIHQLIEWTGGGRVEL